VLSIITVLWFFFLFSALSFPQRLDRSLPGSSPYSMNYQSDNSFHGSSNQSSSYIQSTYSPQFHHQMYSHNVGIPSAQLYTNNSSNHSTKSNSIRYGSNSELSKRTRNQSYELSQDLIDKQIELLERKYGGNVRAQRAALVSLRRFEAISRFN
jgi:hypothetical protein